MLCTMNGTGNKYQGIAENEGLSKAKGLFMEIRVLRYFLEIAREGNMTRAAERLHVTQPTLSKQMKELEQELGKKLFRRGSTSVRLTDEGMLLRKRAEDLLAMADKIENEFKALALPNPLLQIQQHYLTD